MRRRCYVCVCSLGIPWTHVKQRPAKSAKELIRGKGITENGLGEACHRFSTNSLSPSPFSRFLSYADYRLALPFNAASHIQKDDLRFMYDFYMGFDLESVHFLFIVIKDQYQTSVSSLYILCAMGVNGNTMRKVDVITCKEDGTHAYRIGRMVRDCKQSSLTGLICTFVHQCSQDHKAQPPFCLMLRRCTAIGIPYLFG